jgi:ABC-type Zn2+ transport system substrate-binding protein/surface adhesin
MESKGNIDPVNGWHRPGIVAVDGTPLEAAFNGHCQFACMSSILAVETRKEYPPLPICEAVDEEEEEEEEEEEVEEEEEEEEEEDEEEDDPTEGLVRPIIIKSPRLIKSRKS